MNQRDHEIQNEAVPEIMMGSDNIDTFIKVRPLRLEDVSRFRTWGHHTDVRFYGYDFPNLESRSGGYALNQKRWFFKRSIPFLRWLYAIEDAQGNLVGYLKAVKKNVFQNRAELSIVLDPGVMDKGYGSEAIRQFLKICFEEIKLQEVWLRVSEFNVRARRVYTKVGFESCEVRHEPFDDQSHKAELLQNYPDDFFMAGEKLMSRFCYMKITQGSYSSSYKQSLKILLSMCALQGLGHALVCIDCCCHAVMKVHSHL